VQDYKFAIETKKGHPVTYFDIDELKKEELSESHLSRISQPTWQDKLHKFYLMQFRGRQDYQFLTRAVRPDSELLVVGKINFQND
jgi:hypothetical protein